MSPSGAQERKARVAKGLPLYTPNERPARIAASKRYQARRAQRIRDLKTEIGCTDCGYNAHPAALDFDHLPGSVKLGAISQLLKSGAAWHMVVKEIDKCELVCANCHRVRTAQRHNAGPVVLIDDTNADQLAMIP
jgi:hypothetical protein